MTNPTLRPALTKLLLTAALALPLTACLCPETDGWNTADDGQSHQQPPPSWSATGGTPWDNWPDYGAEPLRAALAEYETRQRRYGGVIADDILATG